jgi:sulfite reductase beta subunit-like hemoprotein
MSPASLEDTTQGHSPKQGSLENPEVLENVPGHVIPILEREFDDFDTEAAKFLRGELETDEFTKFRLRQGVYGQRQADVQMVRVKLPMGGVTAEQLDVFADSIEQYAPLRKGHITTRQNIQVHHIPLDTMAVMIREISESGLSSREGCGNTVRNVTRAQARLRLSCLTSPRMPAPTSDTLSATQPRS